jgi:ankyrin repeat protein
MMAHSTRWGQTDRVSNTAPQITRVVWLILVAAAADVFGQDENIAGDHALIIAAERNDVSTIRRLLEAGTNVRARDAQGRTALLAATAHNHIESAKLLIEAGADVNAQDSKFDSPLLLAGASGYLDILKLTLRANPNFKVYNRFGGTALIPACERGHVEVVKELLKTKINIDHVNNLGWTALLEAIVLSDGGPRHQEIVRLLVSAGADINLSDRQGVTPLQHARRSGFEVIANVLESHGAR